MPDASARNGPAAAADRVRRWLTQAALPGWGGEGVDRADGGFVELFDARGRASVPYKRTRVLGRQIYVFSHAALLGWPGALEIAAHGHRFLTAHAELGAGRWARRLDRAGHVLDATQDLYDLAFVLFALAWFARAGGGEAPLAQARATLDALEALRHPEGGFAHELPMRGPRQQNPHMHLLEAALALMETSPSEPRFRALADELATLSERFIDARGTLAEVFTDYLERAPGEAGRRIEPGHCFEWAWILGQHQRLTGADHDEVCRRLFRFASEAGVDRVSGLTLNAVRDDGAPLDRGSRIWPNTERIKGAIALEELGGPPAASTVLSALDALFRDFLRTDGRWVDAIDEHGRPASDLVPASSLYHLFLAFAEVLRWGDPEPKPLRIVL